MRIGVDLGGTEIVDPEAVVLGGGLSGPDRLYRAPPEKLATTVFSDRLDTPVVPPRHGASSGVRGAAWLWPAGGAGLIEGQDGP